MAGGLVSAIVCALGADRFHPGSEDAALATKHGKEGVIAPLLEGELDPRGAGRPRGGSRYHSSYDPVLTRWGRLQARSARAERPELIRASQKASISADHSRPSCH